LDYSPPSFANSTKKLDFGLAFAMQAPRVLQKSCWCLHADWAFAHVVVHCTNPVAALHK